MQCPALGQRARCLVCLACLAACSRSEPRAKPASRPSVAKAAPVAGPALAAAQKPACRAIAVEGTATVNGTPLASGALLDGQAWLELAPGASVALRHTLTSREFKLMGPGKMLPCRNGSEQLLVSSGRLSTSANLGVRPGAEVLIATASTVVRYGDAALDLEYGRHGLWLRVKQGQAWLEPEPQGAAHFRNPLRNDTEVRLPAQPKAPSVLAARCQTAAERARESARRVLVEDHSAAPNALGDRAAAHMRDRMQARAACAMAAAALGSAADSAEMQMLSASLQRSEELWQSVPRP